MFYPEKKVNLSPSSIEAWITNKSQFKSRYFENKSFTTHQMATGTEVHKEIEKGLVPVKKFFSKFEEKYKTDLSFIFEDLELFGIMDGYDGKAEFVDYKTGKKWTQDQVDQSVKQEIYAYMIFKNNPDMNEVIGSIEWVEVEDGQATGETEVLSKKYRRDEVVTIWDERLPEIVQEVNEAYEQFLKEKEEYGENIINTVGKLYEVKTKIKMLQNEESKLKELLEEEMKNAELEKVKTDELQASYMERKVYVLPKGLTAREEELKKEIAGVKKDLQKKGEYEITKIFTVR